MHDWHNLPDVFHIIGKSSVLPYDTKTLCEDAQGLPQRNEGTQTQSSTVLRDVSCMESPV